VQFSGKMASGNASGSEQKLHRRQHHTNKLLGRAP